MMTRKLGFIIIFFLALSLKSQTRTSLECLDREFHVVVHVITDSLFVPTATPVNINIAMTALNKEWAPICVKFNLCKQRVDSNYNFAYWVNDTMEDEYLALHYEPRIINIVVVDTIIKPVKATGYASLGGIASRGNSIIVVAGANPVLWIHEMGHYFGLKHTFEPTIANADNSNCETLDDGVCDTPPDPDEDGASHSGCIYNGTFTDVNGKYYNPLVENFMSYYGGCRKSFTHNQYERMVNTYKLDKEAKF